MDFVHYRYIFTFKQRRKLGCAIHKFVEKVILSNKEAERHKKREERRGIKVRIKQNEKKGKRQLVKNESKERAKNEQEQEREERCMRRKGRELK